MVCGSILESEVKVTARGRTGRVEFDGQFIKIIRRRFVSRITVGKGEKTIPISSITAVQFKPAGWILTGYIQFTLAGGNEVRAKFGSQTYTAALDENSVTFDFLRRKQFLRLRNVVEDALTERAINSTRSPSAAEPSRLERLGLLSELRDSGALTQDEFESEKRRLLTPESGES
jgi:hypothetical protein